MKIFIAASWFR